MSEKIEETVQKLIQQDHENFVVASVFAKAINFRITHTRAPFRHELKNSANLFAAKYLKHMESHVKAFSENKETSGVYNAIYEQVSSIGQLLAVTPPPLFPLVVAKIIEINEEYIKNQNDQSE